MDARESFDRQAALTIAGDDPVLLKELAELFLAEYPTLIAEIRSAVRERDPKKLDAGAHALKGVVANFGAHAAVESALVLEAKGRAGDLDGIDQALAALERTMEPLLVDLAAL